MSQRVATFDDLRPGLQLYLGGDKEPGAVVVSVEGDRVVLDRPGGGDRRWVDRPRVASWSWHLPPTPDKERPKIRVIVDLSGGIVQSVMHDSPEVDLDIVFLTDDTADLCSDDGEVCVRGDGAFKGHWIYTYLDAEPYRDSISGQVFDSVFAAAVRYAAEEFDDPDDDTDDDTDEDDE